MTRRRARNDWRAGHEIHRGVVGIVSRGGNLDAIAREVHACYLRRGWKAPSVAPAPIARCRNPDGPHLGTALENDRCPTCGWRPPGSPVRRIDTDATTTYDIHRAVVGIVSRGGDLDLIAYEIHLAYTRRGWKGPGPTGLLVSRCQNPAGAHRSTALVNGHCPTCGWSPLT